MPWPSNLVRQMCRKEGGDQFIESRVAQSSGCVVLGFCLWFLSVLPCSLGLQQPARTPPCTPSPCHRPAPRPRSGWSWLGSKPGGSSHRREALRKKQHLTSKSSKQVVTYRSSQTGQTLQHPYPAEILLKTPRDPLSVLLVFPFSDILLPSPSA